MPLVDEKKALSNNVLFTAEETATYRLEMGIKTTFQQMRDIMSCSNTSSRKTEMPAEGGPEWKPDEFAKACEDCNNEFSIFLRKHHCRSCGGVFCFYCSNNFTFLVKYGYSEPVRVCTKCCEACDSCQELAVSVFRDEKPLVRKLLAAPKKYKVNEYT